MTSPDNKTLELLLELGNPAERRTRTELLGRAMTTSLALTNADAVVILTPWSRRGERLALHAGSSAHAVLPASSQGSEVARTLVASQEPLVFADLSEDERVAAADACPGVGAGPVMFTPLRQRDSVPGYVAVYRRTGRARFSASDTRSMLLLSAWLGSALENLRLSSGVEKVAVTDDLTSVYNSRFLKAALRRELGRASRFHQELSIVLIDVDNLQSLNEECGDLRGTVLLKEVASLLAQQVRSFDLLAKHDDDEFMLILPQTGREGAVEVAERMRTAVERHSFSLVANIAVTVSLGVAAFPHEGSDTAALMATAARALGRAKQLGKNRVETIIDRAA